MIDGAHEGAFATHPTIAERVAAMISVTGSMALIAPDRHDTRPAELRAREVFGRRPAPALEAAFVRTTRPGASAALARVSSDSRFNRLGLTRELSVGAVAAVGVSLWVHRADLGNPAALVRDLNPASQRALFAMLGKGTRCLHQGLAWTIGLAEPVPADCDKLDNVFAAHPGNDELIGQKESTTRPPKALYTWPDGTFRSAAPPDVRNWR